MNITVINALQKIYNQSVCHTAKPEGRISNKIQVDKGSELHNRSMKSWLKNNGIDIQSTHNEIKSVVDGRFIRILKKKITI